MTHSIRHPDRGAMSADELKIDERSAHWRMQLALALWLGGFLLPLAIPLVTATSLPLATKTTLSGLLIFGLPQLLTVIAIAIVGKSGFHYLMEQLFGAAKKLGPRAHVSRRRYRIGLAMLFVPLALLLLEPYIALLMVREPMPHWVFGA